MPGTMYPNMEFLMKSDELAPSHISRTNRGNHAQGFAARPQPCGPPQGLLQGVSAKSKFQTVMKAQPPATFFPSICLCLALVSTLNLSAAEAPLDWVRSAVPAPDADGWITLFDGRLLHACDPDSIRSRTNLVGVSNGELWLDSTRLIFNVQARNVSLRAVLKKVSGQNVMLECRKNHGQGYDANFKGGGTQPEIFSIGIFNPNWHNITAAKASRNFPDFFRMELSVNDSLITLKANEETLKTTEDLAYDTSGAVAISAYRGKSLFKKVQIKIHDGPPRPPSWTNSEGKTIQAEFVRLEGQSVVVRIDGKEVPIPISKLALSSRNQARDLAAKAPAIADTTPDQVDSRKSFGKQEDPDHQRRLAESILAKKGRVEVWRGSGFMLVTDVRELPAGKLELKAVDAIAAPFSDDDALLLNGCESLTRLNLHRANVEALPFESLDALEWLELFQCDVNPGMLDGLRDRKSIKSISIWHSATPMGHGSISIFSSMPNLEYLNLHKAGLEDKSLAGLSKLKNLRILHLGANDFSDSDFSELIPCPSLEGLYLGDSILMNHSLAFLPRLKTLQRLDFGSSRLSARSFTNIAAMRSLTSLQLYNSNVTDEMLRTLGGHKSLRELLLDLTNVSGSGLIGINPIPTLKTLRLNGTGSAPDADFFESLPVVFPNLSELSVNAKRTDATAIAGLRGLKRLNLLHLQDAAISDEGVISALAKLKSVTDLGLNRSNITPGKLALLEPLKTRLIHLHLENTRIGEESIPFLSSCRALRTLNIVGTDISREGAGRLRQTLKSCTVYH